MLIYGKNLFPLHSMRTAWSHYYVSSDGRIYSTRARKNSLTELKGSVSSYKGGKRYVTLAGHAFEYDYVVQIAKRSNSFYAETADSPDVAFPASELVGKHPGIKDLVDSATGRTRSAKQAIAKKGFMLATVGANDQLIFGSKPMFHTNEKVAEAEAVRIATESGKKVVMLKFASAVSVGKIVWE